MSNWKYCGHEVSGAESECLYCRINELETTLKGEMNSNHRLVARELELEAVIADVEILIKAYDEETKGVQVYDRQHAYARVRDDLRAAIKEQE